MPWSSIHNSELTWENGAVLRRARWLSPTAPAPARAAAVGDATGAAEALARARRGEGLVYTGDYHNARQLLAAMGRRLEKPGGRRPEREGGDLAARFRAERRAKLREHEVLSRLLVPFDAGWRIPLRRAPDVAGACAEAGLLEGPAPEHGLLPLRDLLGIIGAHEWRHRGVEVPALGARVHPHYGVFAPIRGGYVDLVDRACARWPVAGKRALDIGTGTGVLAFVLARHGARVRATDLEPRAVACARENAARLGVDAAVEVVQADLFPAGDPVDLVVANPPWVPETPHTVLDRAVYDPGGEVLARLVRGLDAHVAPGGEAWIVISDLAERLGLRAPGHLAALARDAGWRAEATLATEAVHPRARDAEDPLHAARSAEVTTLFRLIRA
jgi:SAM-dependent methyltransferase